MPLLPSDSQNTTPQYSENDSSPIMPEQRQSLPLMPSDQSGYAQPQAFFLHEAPPPRYATREKRLGLSSNLRLPFNKKVFPIVALFLLVGIVLAAPFVVLKQFSPTNKSTNSMPVYPLHTPTARTVVNPTPLLLGKTILPSAGKIMTGVSISPDLNVVDNFEKDAGKKASILTFYQDWGATDQKFPAKWASSVRKHGSLPLIAWQPWVTKPYPQGNYEPTYALKNIIAGHFDKYIKQWAQGAKTWRNPLFLAFAPEMNGSWNPWDEGLNGNKAGTFVQAWRHVHTIFTSIGASNVTWVWDPNTNFVGSTPLAELYPGDAYVNWTAMDGFNWGTSTKYTIWFPFTGVFGPTYNTILKITHKPMMIAQLSSAEKGGNKAAWISNAYSIALPQHFTAIKAVVWFDQVGQSDWRIESSMSAQQAFSRAIQAPIYAANIYGNYNGG